MPKAAKRGGDAVADVAMRDALDVAQSQGQEGLGALQGLALTLLGDEDHRMVGRIQAGPTMSRTFSAKKGSVESWKVLLPVGLEVERGPEALDRGLGHSGGFGHGPAGPVCAAVGRTGLERLPEQRHDGVVPGWSAAVLGGVRRRGP